MSSPNEYEPSRFQIKKDDCHPERSGLRVQRGGSEVEEPTHGSVLNPHPLTQLRQFTPARIALGRTGSSLPIKELLEFTAAHALARDAVHTQFNMQAIIQQLTAANLESIQVHSAAVNRTTYLRRPDLGRKLNEPSRKHLTELKLSNKPEIVFIIADGLSAIAPQSYAVQVIKATCDLLSGWAIGPVILTEQARVALGDEIGELLQAEITVMLIGERPGLSSADSLGIYLTYAPRVGRTDAERNCISNIRDEGTTPEQAAHTLHYLMTNARRLQFSGVQLKDQSQLHSTQPIKHLSS